MNIRKVSAVILAALFVSLNWLNAGSPKKKLKEQNLELQAKLDSLSKELKEYKYRLEISDSLYAALLEELSFDKEVVEDTSEKEELFYCEQASDSLLNFWYAHKYAADGFDFCELDTMSFQSNVSDEEYVRRLTEMNSFITLPYNSIVKNNIILYSEKMAGNMGHILGLCQYYMPQFQEIFDRYDMPEELWVMAIIESKLNPQAISRAGAKGMWQFMYHTAKAYNLKIDSFVDERLDPIKSADAAARYLRDAYRIFGDWNLAIASYNCGAGNVKKAIKYCGGSTKFWDIYPYLPRETRGYLPAFVGALYTVNYYKEHGIKPIPVELPVAVDTFKVNKMLHLKQVSELTGASLEELKRLNPQYRHEIIPGNEAEYILRIPYEHSDKFIENKDTLFTHKADVYFNPVTIKKIKDGGDGERIVYRVKSGDVLGRIAINHRCTVKQIMRWNNLRSTNIRIGQRLILYRGGRQ